VRTGRRVWVSRLRELFRRFNDRWWYTGAHRDGLAGCGHVSTSTRHRLLASCAIGHHSQSFLVYNGSQVVSKPAFPLFVLESPFVQSHYSLRSIFVGFARPEFRGGGLACIARVCESSHSGRFYIPGSVGA